MALARRESVEASWFLVDGANVQRGPLFGADVAAMLAVGELDEAATLVWRPGMHDWAALSAVRAQLRLQVPAPEPGEAQPAPPPLRFDGVGRLRCGATIRPATAGGGKARTVVRGAPHSRAGVAAPPPVSVSMPSTPRARDGAQGAQLEVSAAGSPGLSALLSPLRQACGRFRAADVGGTAPGNGHGAAVASRLAETCASQRAAGAAPDAAPGAVGWLGRLVQWPFGGRASAESPRSSPASAPPSNPRAAASSVAASAAAASRCFGVDLDELVRREGGASALPRVFTELSDRLSAPPFVHTMGLFRVSAEHARVRDARAALDAGAALSSQLAGSVAEEAHVAAALLKLFLRELPEPVCPRALYADFLTAGAALGAGGDAGDVLRPLLRQLPAAHAAVLRALCALLRTVTAEAARNRMTARALANVFAPTVFQPPRGAPGAAENPLAALSDVVHTAQVMCALLDASDELLPPASRNDGGAEAAVDEDGGSQGEGDFVDCDEGVGEAPPTAEGAPVAAHDSADGKACLAAPPLAASPPVVADPAASDAALNDSSSSVARPGAAHEEGPAPNRPAAADATASPTVVHAGRDGSRPSTPPTS